MRVFVTGASGFIGQAVTRELITAGHEVLGLARSEDAAATVRRNGGAVHRGSLDDLRSLQTGAEAADGTIHLAFNHDFSDFAGAIATEQRAVTALLDALAGSGRTLIATFGTAFVRPGQLLTEDDAPAVGGPNGRAAIEHAVLGGASRGLRPIVMRLPFTVHGAGDKGFLPFLIGAARTAGASIYLGDGANRWPAVHRDDAARAYRLALEHGAGRGHEGARFHAVAETGIPFRRIAEAIGAGLGVPVRSATPDEAAPVLRWAAGLAGCDAPTASDHTRTTLGWEPTGPDLLSDLGAAGYFAAP